MGLEKNDDPREVRARKIMAAARANIANHPSREARVAATFKAARDNIAKYDPKRFPFASAHEQRLHREVAAARQQRIKRTLRNARDTLARTRHVVPPCISESVHETTTDNARVERSLRQETAPQFDATEGLADRFNVLREALPQVVADLRAEWQRENDCLRRELDVTYRELDLLRRTLAGSQERPS